MRMVSVLLIVSDHQGADCCGNEGIYKMKKWQLIVLQYFGSILGDWAKKKLTKQPEKSQKIDKPDENVV